MTSLRSSSWSRIVLNPIDWAPELSMRSGGLPPTKRGCSSWAICVDGETSTRRALVGLLEDVGGELDVVDAVAAVEDDGVDRGAVGHAERVDRVPPACWDGRGADDAGLGQIWREGDADAGGRGTADEAAPVGGPSTVSMFMSWFTRSFHSVRCHVFVAERSIDDVRRLPQRRPVLVGQRTRSAEATDPAAVAVFEGVVVFVTSWDVGRDVDRRRDSRLREALGDHDREHLGDERRGDRRDGPDTDAVGDRKRGVAVGREVVDARRRRSRSGACHSGASGSRRSCARGS